MNATIGAFSSAPDKEFSAENDARLARTFYFIWSREEYKHLAPPRTRRCEQSTRNLVPTLRKSLRTAIIIANFSYGQKSNKALYCLIVVGFKMTKPTNGKAVVAQLVEHILGRNEVTGPIPVNGSEL